MQPRWKITVTDPTTKDVHVVKTDAESTMVWVREFFLDYGKWVDVYDYERLV